VETSGHSSMLPPPKIGLLVNPRSRPRLRLRAHQGAAAVRLSLLDAVREAKAYVTAALKAADRLQRGSGAGPVHHFHKWW
jgi:hypothetical protein